MGMSALGWELPLDAICVNGSFAQKVYFAKSNERPKTTVRVGRTRCSAASLKQTLIRCCSIVEVLRSAKRDQVSVRSCTNGRFFDLIKNDPRRFKLAV
jgi:hypothetical protein